MATGLGTATIDFGSHPGSNEAEVTVTGQTTISTDSDVSAFIMADDTSSNHTSSDHKYFPVFASLSCGNPTAGVGFTIYGRSIHKLTGTFTLRWVWSD